MYDYVYNIFNRKEKSVSPVVGVILMVAIVVALVSLTTVVVFNINNGNQDDTSVAGVQVEDSQGTNVTVKLINDERTSEIVVETVGGQKTLSDIGEVVTMESFGEQLNVIGVTDEGSRSVIRTFNPSNSGSGTVSNNDIIYVDPEASTTSSILAQSKDTLEAAEATANKSDSIIIRSGIHTVKDTVQATVSKDVRIGVQKNTIFKCAPVNGNNVSLNFTRAPAVVNGAENIELRGCNDNGLPPELEDNFSVSLSDRTVIQGDQTTISANISDIGPSDIQSIQWDFDDGSGATGNPVVNTFSSVGTYTVTVDVTSQQGSTESASAVFDVVSSPSGQLDPVAAFTSSPEGPTVNQKVQFDANYSMDQDGSIVSYEWDLDNDGVFESSGVETSKVYNSTGEKNVRLRVVDNDGNANEVISAVRVRKGVAEPSSYEVSINNKTIPIGESSLFFVNISKIDESRISSIDWTFGDGNSASGNPTTNTYSSTGEYNVLVTTTSDQGITKSDTATVNVTSNPPPVEISPKAAIDISPSSPTTEQLVKFNGNESQDIDGEIVSYEWDLNNDGTFEKSGVEVSRTYDSFGSQIVNLRVTDNDGNIDEASSTVFVDTIIRIPDSFAVDISNKTVPVGQNSVFSANISSIGQINISNVDWDFGDGSSGSGNPSNNTYSSSGDYDVSVTVNSKEGQTRSDTAVVNVTSSSVQIDPEAAINITPTGPDPRSPVLFNASESQDIDGSILSYQWDLDNDGTFDKTGVEVKNSYNYSGEQDVVLRVTDDDGNTDTVIGSVLILDSAGGDDSGGTTQTISGDVEVNPDINGAIVKSIDADTGSVIDSDETTQTGNYEVAFEESGDEIIVITENDTMLNGRGFYATAKRTVDLDNSGDFIMNFNFTETTNATVNGEAVTVAYNISQEDGPKQIGHPYELQAINTSGNSTYELVRDIDLSNTKNWNNGKGFRIIGNHSENKDFHHILDGNNYTVSGLYQNVGDTQTGLIGLADGATVKNLQVKNFNISSEGFGGGVLIGWKKDNAGKGPTEIRNVKISDGKIEGKNYVGLAVGYPTSDSSSKTIIERVTTENVTINSVPTGDPSYATSGGFIGGLDNDKSIIRKSNISLTINNPGSSSAMGYTGQGDVSIMNTSVDYTHNNGSSGAGLLITSYSRDYNVKNVDLTVDINTTGYAGGIAPFVYGNYRNISISGEVESSQNYAGGFGADVYGATIRDAHMDVDVESSGVAGGIAGYYYGDAKRVYVEGSVNGSSSVGGLFGWADGGTFENAHTVATVTGSSGSSLGGASGSGTSTTFTETYYDYNRTGQSSTSHNAVGLNSTEMEEISNFNFDFDNRWSMNPYPVLDIQGPQGDIGYSN